MPYRQYPNVDRALRQIDRGGLPVAVPPWKLKLAEQANAAWASAENGLRPWVDAMRRIRETAPPTVGPLVVVPRR